LRGRIGKQRGNSRGGLTTANFPNRQRYQQQQHAYPYGDNGDSDMDQQNTHGLIITKPVNQHGISPSSITSSSPGLARATRIGRTGEVDPSTIVITKNIENIKDTTPSPPNENRGQQQQQDQQQQKLLQQLQEAERLKQYLQQQQEQQLRQEMDRHLQQQVKSQREIILDLQRQLDQRTTQQSLMQQQQQTMHLNDGGRDGSFSFRTMVNSNDGIPPYNRSGPNIVLLSNLDINATANDVKVRTIEWGKRGNIMYLILIVFVVVFLLLLLGCLWCFWTCHSM
jgi:hypothetical protein